MAVHICSVGFMSLTLRRALMISWRFDRVDHTPWRVRTMWPLSVADNGGKCLDINSILAAYERFDCLGKFVVEDVEPRLDTSLSEA